MDILKVFSTFKDFGLRNVAKLISYIAWLLLPFWAWFLVYKYTGTSFFNLAIAFIGLILLPVSIGTILSQVYFFRAHGFKTMKLIEKAVTLFDNPKDDKATEEFKIESKKSVLAFTHQQPFVLSGIAGIFGKWYLFASDCLRSLYLSYSVSTLIVVFQGEITVHLNSLTSSLSEFFSPLLSSWPFQNILQLQQLQDWFFQNPWLSLFTLLLLSLYADPLIYTVRFARESKISMKVPVINQILSIPLISTRVIYISRLICLQFCS